MHPEKSFEIHLTENGKTCSVWTVLHNTATGYKLTI